MEPARGLISNASPHLLDMTDLLFPVRQFPLSFRSRQKVHNIRHALVSLVFCLPRSLLIFPAV